MDKRKVAKGISLNFLRTVGLFFVLIAILQFQDNFVGYAFVSLGIAALIFYFTFRGIFRNKKPL
jgi:hypothetical protein